MTTEINNKVGATITYDSPHALDAARRYKEQLAGQLAHKLKNRPFSAAEQKRNQLGTRLVEASLGKAALPQNYSAALPRGMGAPSSSGGIQTDPYLRRTGADYSGSRNANLDDDSWVKETYKSLLNRDADQEDLSYWKSDLAGGQTRDQVVANIKRGEEYGRNQQNQMRDLISPKTPTDILNETYNEQLSTYGRAWQDAQDAVQKEHKTPQDYSPLLTTESNIYTQDPEASKVASLNYLTTVDPSDSQPGIFTQALKSAGANAIKNIDIPGIVSGFFNRDKPKYQPKSFLKEMKDGTFDSKTAREASDW